MKSSGKLKMIMKMKFENDDEIFKMKAYESIFSKAQFEAKTKIKSLIGLYNTDES